MPHWRFNELHPDIELAIDPTTEFADFRSGEADVGIRYGAGQWDDVEANKLTDATAAKSIDITLLAASWACNISVKLRKEKSSGVLGPKR